MPHYAPPHRTLVTRCLGTLVIISVMMICPTASLQAAIFGGDGNSPVRDPGWPQGAAAIFNNAARIAWWEGPPFGGGQWHAECRGDAQQLNAVLADVPKLDVKSKRIVVHDGVGRSLWLNPNDDPAKRSAAQTDWVFMVWQPANWERLRKMPADLNPTDQRDAEHGPPSQIDVYVGGNIRWADVQVPAELPVVDERLEAHGFTLADGVVLEGRVTDLATREPVMAYVVLQHVEPQSTGGYRYTTALEVVADDEGHWVMKHVPAGWYRVVAQTDDYVPRVLGYARFGDQPGWYAYEGGLSRPAPVSGVVRDDAGAPLADVKVRLDNVAAGVGGRYESIYEYTAQTDADGRFRIEQVPAGKASVWIHKSGYCRPGLGEPIVTPTDQVELQMTKSVQVCVTVDFSGIVRPAQYIVEMEPEGGSQVGKWGGSGVIDAQNQITFRDVPPGRYVLAGRPNPGSDHERSPSVTVDLPGGATVDVKLSAK